MMQPLKLTWNISMIYSFSTFYCKIFIVEKLKELPSYYPYIPTTYILPLAFYNLALLLIYASFCLLRV